MSLRVGLLALLWGTRALAEGEQVWLLDVREEWEHQLASLAQARLIPLGELPDRLGELPRDRPVYFLCHHGVRSYRACQWAAHAGCEAVNVEGGIDAWSQDVDSSVPRY